MQAVFYGVGASVIGIITISAYKLTLKTIGQSRLLWFLFLCSAVVTIITESESIWLFLGAGMLAWVLRTTPWKKASSTTTAFEPFALLAAAPAAKASFQELLTQIALFFTKAGAFVFGSGLAKGYHIICRAIKATFDRRKTSIPASRPLALTVEFSEDKQKSTQWNAFLRKSNLASKNLDLTEIAARLANFLMPPAEAASQGKDFRKFWKPMDGWIEKLRK